MTGYSITIIPYSWAFGRWDIRKKTLWAFGPFRFGIHRGITGVYGAPNNEVIN
jgi:hypothetical protein